MTLGVHSGVVSNMGHLILTMIAILLWFRPTAAAGEFPPSISHTNMENYKTHLMVVKGRIKITYSMIGAIASSLPTYYSTTSSSHVFINHQKKLTMCLE